MDDLNRRKRVIVVGGPTASGKTSLAIDLALELNTDIISADSRQLYRGIPIITAVPSEHERRGVPHHLLEALGVEDYFSAALFEQQAMRIISQLHQEKDAIVVCGGSMLYIDALVRGLDDLPTVPDDIRRRTAQEYAQNGIGWLRAEVERVDPEYFVVVDKNNAKRMVHALEIIRASGRPFSEMRTGRCKSRPWDVEMLLLNPDRPSLFARINARVDAMMAAGALEEARRMLPYRHCNSLNTVGFKELFAYFDGEMTLEEAVERIKKNTRVYAKKQQLWVRKWLDAVPVQGLTVREIIP